MFISLLYTFTAHLCFCCRLQSAALREFDFLHNEDREVSRSGPLILGSLPSSAPTTPIIQQPEMIVPPSPQPLVEFPDDEVIHTFLWCLYFLTYFKSSL